MLSSSVACLSWPTILMLNLYPALCTGSFHLLPPAWTGALGHRESRQSGMCTRSLLFLSTKQVFLHPRKLFPLGGHLSFVYREECFCDTQALQAPVSAAESTRQLAQAGGVLMLPPATREHRGCPAGKAVPTVLTTDPTLC